MLKDNLRSFYYLVFKSPGNELLITLRIIHCHDAAIKDFSDALHCYDIC